MIIENTEAFKSWLISRLSRICDADPTALANYILALVKKEKTEDELREFCLDQLDVFLMRETKPFVDLLFEALKTKSYLSSSSDSHPKDSLDIGNQTNNTKSALNSSDHGIAQNDSSKNIKSETDGRSDHVNSENGSGRSKPALSSTVKVKSSGSPEHSHRSYRHRSRSRGREISENRKKDEKNDKNSKHESLPSKKFKSRSHHYSKNSDKFRDEKSERRGSRRRKEQMSDEDGMDDRGKSISRSNSWDKGRSRSHSSSHSSRSRSRERSIDDRDKTDFHTKSETDRSLKIQHADHGDTDYRQKPPSAIVPTQLNSYSSKRISKRCQDYDERGYCLRGDLCVYDHGTDPILVEDVSSVLNFGVVSQDRYEDATGTKSPKQPPPPPSSPPPLPPPPPPLPPLPPPGYVPEPYNPEAPGMNVVPRVNYWVPPPVHHMTPPHHPPPPLPPAGAGIPGMMFNLSEMPPPFHKTHRTRELIGVPTVGNLTVEKEREKERSKDAIKSDENSENCLKPYTVDEKNKSVAVVNELKRKSFDYSRLGASPRKIVKKMNNGRCTLEVRKIPQHLNTISMLNSHFSKFGRIVNLQVGYDGDPEAALVQFMTDSEATAAYRCAEAILNNRFIKVFYHNPQRKDEDKTNSEISINTLNRTNQLHSNNSNELNAEDVRQSDVLRSNMSTIYTSKGNLSRTVFIPSAKKTTPNFTSTPTPVITQTRRINKDPVKKQGAMQKLLELHKKKQDFLKVQIAHQKVFVDKLSKCKNEKEKEFLKQTIQTLAEKIASIQNDVKKDSLELKNMLKTANTQPHLTKTEAEKELLDAEMDLYNKQHTGDDTGTAELLSKVIELKKKAKALGLLDNLPHPPQIGPQSRHVNSRYSSRNVPAFSHHSVDHRPRKILVTGSTNKEGLTKHFMQYGNIEKVEETSVGLIFTFSTRLEAEAAHAHGSKFGDIVLSVSWFHDPQLNAVQNTDHNDSETKQVTSPVPEGDDEEEEDDEEDSEARSWRR